MTLLISLCTRIHIFLLSNEEATSAASPSEACMIVVQASDLLFEYISSSGSLNMWEFHQLKFSNFFSWLFECIKLLMQEPSDELPPCNSELVIIFLKFLYDKDPMRRLLEQSEVIGVDFCEIA